MKMKHQMTEEFNQWIELIKPCDPTEEFNQWIELIKPCDPTIIGTDMRGYTYVYVAKYGAKTAIELMKNARLNRLVHPDWIRKNSTDYLAGDYKNDLKGFGFTSEGVMFEGHHRSAALIQADNVQPGITIDGVFIFGMPEDAWEGANEAKGGTTTDFWRQSEKQYASILSKTLSLIISYFKVGDFSRKGFSYATTQAQKRWLSKYPEIEITVKFFGRKKDGRELPLSYLSAVDFILASWVGTDKAREFMEQIVGGSATEGSPAAQFNAWKQVRRQEIRRTYTKEEVAYTLMSVAKKQFKNEQIRSCKIVREIPTWE